MPSRSRYHRSRIRDPERRNYVQANPTAFGGSLSKTRWGRQGPRPISDLVTMNLTLRSTQAKGSWSFRTPKNFQAIEALTKKFAARFKVEVIRLSNNHNHLHFHVRFPSRKAYLKFIRALSAAIMIAVTGVTRWTKAMPRKFWDNRPFTRVVCSLNEYANYDNYLDLNDLEAEGFPREVARWILKMRWWVRFGGSRPPPERWA